MKNTLQNKLQSDNISEEINKIFLELQIDESENIKIKYYKITLHYKTNSVE